MQCNKPEVQVNSREGVRFLTFDSLDLPHACFLSCPSQSQITSLLDCHSVVTADRQCHGTRIVEALPGLSGGECDGFVTGEPGVALLIRHADCQAALFYDPVKKRIANIHCGWRGNVANIYGEVIRSLKSDPKDLFVFIGPSFGPCCAQFTNYREQFPSAFHAFQPRPSYFDFWAISRMQLQEGGIPKEQITVAEICTCCAGTDFFSYRRNRTEKRHFTVISLREL